MSSQQQVDPAFVAPTLEIHEHREAARIDEGDPRQVDHQLFDGIVGEHVDTLLLYLGSAHEVDDPAHGQRALPGTPLG